MTSLTSNIDKEKDLDDSGCVQDEVPSCKRDHDHSQREVSLLDLSDDVLLFILQYCNPLDLKALGFTCPRLGYLIQDHTLWSQVDARSQPTSRARLQWYLDNVLNDTTTCLKLSGYARDSVGCMGHINRSRPSPKPKETVEKPPEPQAESSTSTVEEGSEPSQEPSTSDNPRNFARHPRCYVKAAYTRLLPRFLTMPIWPTQEELEESVELEPEPEGGKCRGPQFTVSPRLLDRLTTECNLKELALEYCNIDCKATAITKFPPTLKKLSLRGTRCYNMTLDKCVLFKIYGYLQDLEEMDISECDWVDGSCFLPLSKLSKLKKLVAQNCRKLSDFVAYASLATTYGFHNLEVVDFRGSPVGDAETAAFGWLPNLLELYLQRNRACSPFKEHAHYNDDVVQKHCHVADWEIMEPEYFKRHKSTPEPDAEAMPQVPEPSESELPKTNVFTITLNPSGRPIVENGPPPNLGFIPVPLQPDNQENRRRPRSPARADASCQAQEQPQRPENPSTSNEGEPQTKRRRLDGENQNGGESSSDVTDEIPAKRSRSENVNEGASTSSGTDKNGDAGTSRSNDERKSQGYVKFRMNRPPVVVNGDGVEEPQRNQEEPQQNPIEPQRNQQEPQRNQQEPPRNQQEPQQQEPNQENNDVDNVVRIRILPDHNAPRAQQLVYVNFRGNSRVNDELNELANQPQVNVPRNRIPFVRNVTYATAIPLIDPATHITDSAVLGFGYSDTMSGIRTIRLAGAVPRRSKPQKSPLTKLVCVGFKGVTNSSLIHLATGAPNLRFIDFSETGVTEAGVERFLSVRPDCQVIYSPFEAFDSENTA